jgi:phosphate starvation-inducible PhoH-like protein
MARKPTRRQAALESKRAGRYAPDEDFTVPAKERRETGPVEAKTANQSKYLKAIRNKTIVFSIGPAGTGKSYVVAAEAAEQLKAGEVEQIILTRPAVETGPSMGFLPGTLEEKYAPFLDPFKDTLQRRLGKSAYDAHLKNEKIAPRPLSHMRGATFKNAVAILDEAQNITPHEMLMFLTRIGEGSTVVINGDLEQQDIPGLSGLRDAIERLEGHPDVAVIEFTVL